MVFSGHWERDSHPPHFGFVVSKRQMLAPKLWSALALGWIALVLCRGEECPSKYVHFSAKHTFCLPKNNTCKVLRRHVEQQDKAVILQEHNRLRSELAVGEKANPINLPRSSRMMQLAWDKELEEIAQRHADQCRFEHDCSDCRRVESFPVGQNLYLDSLEGATKAPEPNWTAAVSAWYDEIQYFQPHLLAPFVPSPSGAHTYGHFSQVVWGDSWKVGCGYAQYTEGKKFFGLYVCNYGPTGNVNSGKMYTLGEPCLNCPLNSVCHNFANDDALPGLCVMQRDEAPKYPPPEDATFYCSFSGEEDCAHAVTEGSANWRPVNTLSGNWLRVELKGGEHSTLSLTQPFSGGAEGICFSFTFGKGPVSAQDKPAHDTLQSYASGDDVVDSPLPPESAESVQYSMSLGWEEDTTVSYTFSVPEEAAPQFFQIKDLKAKKGACPAS